MSANPPALRRNGPGTRWRYSAVLLAAHLAAARLAPRAWLTALWWRILGKKVRARAQFTPLLSATQHAYRLWLMCEPPLPRSGQSCSVIVLVAEGPGQEASAASARAEGFTPYIVHANDSAAALAEIGLDGEAWVMLLLAGDLLASGSGEVYRAYGASARQDEVQVIYADDDLIDAQGKRHSPHFKPRWNAELFRHLDYLTGACMVRASAIAPASGRTHDWPHKLVSQAANSGGTEPLRIPYVLHHRRSRPAPCTLAGKPMIMSEPPTVSVIVPTRNQLGFLRNCLEGLERTNYPDMEVIVVDNGSDDPATLAYLGNLDPARYRLLRDAGPFNFSRLNNQASELARGDLLCFLNNDIEVMTRDWLLIMASQAKRDDVGAVGAKLLYPDGRIQHAGVVMGICGGAAHAHRLLRPTDEGYFRRHDLPQFVSAVTAACLVLRRERFLAAGRFDEQAFPVAFNDVDLCLRLNLRGWQSFYEPRATLIHHESVSRGLDRDPVGAARFAGELAALQARWKTNDWSRECDPYHHPQLSRYSEHFVVRVEV